MSLKDLQQCVLSLPNGVRCDQEHQGLQAEGEAVCADGGGGYMGGGGAAAAYGAPPAGYVNSGNFQSAWD